MKCTLNGNDIFDLSQTQLSILKHTLPADLLEEHIKGLIHYIIGQKLRESAGKLFEEWKPKLAKEGVTSVPLMDIDLAQMIFDRPDYVPFSAQEAQPEAHGFQAQGLPSESN